MDKDLLYIRCEGYDMIASIDDDRNVRFLTETEDFPVRPGKKEAREFLEAVEDDSSWEEMRYNVLLVITLENTILAEMYRGM